MTDPGSIPIHAVAVVKTYRSSAGSVLDAVACASLDVRRGQLVAIVGESGSGKSTFLQILGGLIRPTAGSVEIAGADITAASSDDLARLRRKTVGYVFQAFNLLPQLTAVENVELAMWGVPASERRAIAIELLATMGVGARVDHRPSELSTGEQQRVALARALVNDPAIILGDEPSGNLDPERQGELIELFRHAADEGRSVVLVTHSPVVAASADRVLRMRAGALLDA